MEIESKTEKQKMLDGDLYLAGDPELVNDRFRARQILRKYNGLSEIDLNNEDLFEQRSSILKELFGNTGDWIWIEPPFYCDYGYNIHLADMVYMNFNCIILDPNTVHIGERTMFGPSVQIITADHPLDAEKRVSGPELAAPVKIGKRVWVGGGAIILPGVTIGDDTTIGAGSIVTKDIPANVVAVGNPCRVVKKL